ELFFSFTFGYGYLRFLLEIVRDDSERGSFGPALAEQVLVPAALLLFAAAFAYGPAQGIARGAPRRVAVALGVVVAGVAYLVLRPLHGSAAQVVSLSTSQWISLITALAVAFAWRRALDNGPAAKSARVQPRPLSST
ncbi:MAG: hypothetical protein ABIQ16_19790, partial [Polyangiaceae bacterium]